MKTTKLFAMILLAGAAIINTSCNNDEGGEPSPSGDNSWKLKGITYNVEYTTSYTNASNTTLLFRDSNSAGAANSIAFNFRNYENVHTGTYQLVKIGGVTTDDQVWLSTTDALDADQQYAYMNDDPIDIEVTVSDGNVTKIVLPEVTVKKLSDYSVTGTLSATVQR